MKLIWQMMARSVAEGSASEQADFVCAWAEALRDALGPENADLRIAATVLELLKLETTVSGCLGIDLVEKLASYLPILTAPEAA